MSLPGETCYAHHLLARCPLHEGVEEAREAQLADQPIPRPRRFGRTNGEAGVKSMILMVLIVVKQPGSFLENTP